MPENRTRLVYSTDKPVLRSKGTKEQDNSPALKPLHQKTAQKVLVRLDRKQRAGKTVTVIEGLVMQIKEREALLRRLKSGLGTGGTVRDTLLEIQGDHCDAVIDALTDLGFRPKRSGG